MRIERMGPVLAFLVLVTGCQTPADRWLAVNLRPQEKAEILVEQGAQRYNQMVDEDALERIPQIREVFQTALTTDPLNTKAADYLKKVDGFQKKRQNEAQSKVKILTAKSNLSDREKYNLVLLVQQLQVLAPKDFDLSKLTAQVTPIRQEVLKKSTQNLIDSEKALAAAKTDAAAGKALSAVHNAINDLKAIDPGNSTAAASAAKLSAYLAQRNKTDLDLAKKAYGAKDYATAAKALNRVEQALSSVGTEGAQGLNEVNDLQYKVYLDWARDLFQAKKYAEAGSRVNDALGVKLTSEAKELKDKIAALAQSHDYDAEYDTIDKQLDGLIKAGELKAAWNLAAATLPQLKKDDNKNRLATRRKQTLEAAHELYDASVASYNEEDYQEAKLGFDEVVAIDPAWQLVKAYQEKARAKLQALGGN